MASGRREIPIERLEKLITDGGKKFVSYRNCSTGSCRKTAR